MMNSKKSPVLALIMTAIIVLPSTAQNNANSMTVSRELYLFHAKLKLDHAQKEQAKQTRAKEVRQDNEYIVTGKEKGIFLSDPLMLDGRPLDYGEFDIRSTGEMTVNKGSSGVSASVMVPFYVYLKRNGSKVLIPGRERPDARQLKIEVSEILDHAEPGDLLVIEAVNEEDGSIKRILKVLGGGC
jgi:hypothetical protein